MESFLEYLEKQVDLKRPCSITFRFFEGGVSTVRAHIVRLEEVSGRKIIETDAGLVIGLDQIQDVNGRQPANYC